MHGIRFQPAPGGSAPAMPPIGPNGQALLIGGYYRTERSLYRVEAQIGRHVVAEDCCDGLLFDVPLELVRSWIPVGDPPTAAGALDG
jgi:hypothetical protein